jgi:hypothetical protein
MLYWLLYFAAALTGINAFPAITESDSGMLTCYFIGTILTTISIIFIRWKNTPILYQLTFAGIVGFFSWIPGYLVALLIGALGIF